MLSRSEGADFSCRAELVPGIGRSEASAEMNASACKIMRLFEDRLDAMPVRFEAICTSARHQIDR
jgi:hypothetical protein